MESSASGDPSRAVFPFLSLPTELREIVYLYSCHPNQIQNVWEDVYDKLVDVFNEEEAIYNAQEPEVAFKGNFWAYSKRLNPRNHFAMTTPVLMLLNRQTYAEVKDLLRREPFVVQDYPRLDYELGMKQGFEDYMPEASITHLLNVEIVYTEAYRFIIAPMVRWFACIWLEENHLEKLVVRFKDRLKGYQPRSSIYASWNVNHDGTDPAPSPILADSDIAIALRKLHRAFPYEIVECVDEDGRVSDYRKDMQIGERHD